MNRPSPVRSVRKRRRPAYSCTECRRRKVRCDRAVPCGQCKAHGNSAGCAYEEHPRAFLPITASSAQQDDRTQNDIQLSPHAPTPNTTPSNFQGIVSKTRVFGHGHWMAAFSMADELSTLEPVGEYWNKVFEDANHCPTDDIAQAAAECKRLARDVKRQRPSRRCLPAAVHDSFPDRQVMHELVNLYFNTFELCYRILYFPSFMAEYESCIDHLESAESTFLLQLLLVMTAAGTLHGDASIRLEISTRSRSWIHICQTWLSAPLEKSRLTLKGIQVQCLLLLCRQIHQVGPDLVWISMGSLMRMAMYMGLHQDPNNFAGMTLKDKEIRRRLWYTILEFNVQAALDSGISPMIQETDYNTQPPANACDDDLENAVQEEVISNNPTPILLQSLLAKSLPLRLEVARIINSLQEEPSYDHILAISNELASACRNLTAAVDETTSARDAQPTTQFAQNYCSHLLRRFSLCLHFRYALKAKKNALYSHSQKVCLEAALDLVALLEDELYSRLLVTGGGMFRDIITRGALLIFLELTPDPETETSNSAKRRSHARQGLLLQDARRVVQYAEDRIRHGETNVKGYVFLRMMLVQAEGRFNGSLTDEDLRKSLNDGLDTCQQILEGLAADKLNTNNNTIDSDLVLELWASNGTNRSSPAGFGPDALNFLDDNNADFDFINSLFPSGWTI